MFSTFATRTSSSTFDGEIGARFTYASPVQNIPTLALGPFADLNPRRCEAGKMQIRIATQSSYLKTLMPGAN